MRPTLRIDRIDVSKPPTVRIYLTQLDRSGKVLARKPGGYRLLANSLPQPEASRVERFIDRQEPLALTLVLQTAPSMSPVFKEVIAGSGRLIDGLPRGSMVGLVAYAEVVNKELKPTSISTVKKALGQLGIKEAIEMQLPDAVRDAAEGLGSRRLPAQRRMLVVSDGITADIKLRTFSKLGRRTKERGIAIHSIGFAPLEPRPLRTLHAMSRRSGGTFRATSNGAQLKAAFDAFRDELRQQRVLTYKLPKLFIGKVVDFQIYAGDGVGSNIVQAELVKWAVGQELGGKRSRRWYTSPLVVVLLIGSVLMLLTALSVVFWRIRLKRVLEHQRKLVRMENVSESSDGGYDDDVGDDDEAGEEFYGGKGLAPSLTSFGLPKGEAAVPSTPAPAAGLTPAAQTGAALAPDAPDSAGVSAGVAPAGVAPAGVAPAGVAPAGVAPAGVAPAGVLVSPPLLSLPLLSLPLLLQRA